MPTVIVDGFPSSTGFTALDKRMKHVVLGPIYGSETDRSWFPPEAEQPKNRTTRILPSLPEEA